MSSFNYEALQGLTADQQQEIMADVRAAERAELEEADRRAADRREGKEITAQLDAEATRGETWAARKARIAAIILAERKAAWAARAK